MHCVPFPLKLSLCVYSMISMVPLDVTWIFDFVGDVCHPTRHRSRQHPCRVQCRQGPTLDNPAARCQHRRRRAGPHAQAEALRLQQEPRRGHREALRLKKYSVGVRSWLTQMHRIMAQLVFVEPPNTFISSHNGIPTFLILPDYNRTRSLVSVEPSSTFILTPRAPVAPQ